MTDFYLPPANWPKLSNDDIPVGWAGSYSIPNNNGFKLHAALYRDIVAWIQANINRPFSNVHWAKMGDCIYVQFRKKSDFTLFLLRWTQ